MKRGTAILILTFSLILAACAASTTSAENSLEGLPRDYSLEDAKADNCVTFEDGDITSGQPVWDEFVKTAEEGKSASVRLAFYYTLGDPSEYSAEYYEEAKDDYPALYILDLLYDGEKYVLESMENGRLISQEYKYLVEYEGKPSSPYATFSWYTYYVLVDDDSVTWEYIEKATLSSDSKDWIAHHVVYSDLVFK